MTALSDLEITRLCAEAMGVNAWASEVPEYNGMLWITHGIDNVKERYNPLGNDAQATALVKKFRLLVHPLEPPISDEPAWYIAGENGEAEGTDLNRAICLCVAAMQAKP